MICAWRTYGKPAVVLGSVVPRFAVPPSDWITAGRLCERSRFPSGTILPGVMSGNLLADLDQIRAFGTTSDSSLGLVRGKTRCSPGRSEEAHV